MNLREDTRLKRPMERVKLIQHTTSTHQPTRALVEFVKIPFYTPVASNVEKVYIQKGLLPPLSGFQKKLEPQLEDILKPRPFVKPIVWRKPARSRTTTTRSDDSRLDDGLEVVPGPSVELSIYEDLEGIADVAPATPRPAIPSPSRSTPGPSRKKVTARKSTTPNAEGITQDTAMCEMYGIKPCKVVLKDILILYPRRTRKLLEQFYCYKSNCSQPITKRKDSTDSGHATDEPDERLVPPLKIRLPKQNSIPSVHDVLGKVAICKMDPPLVTIEESSDSAELRGITSAAFPGPALASSPSCDADALESDEKPPQTSLLPPSRKRAIHQEPENLPPKKRAVEGLPEETSIPQQVKNQNGPPAPFNLQTFTLLHHDIIPFRSILKNKGHTRTPNIRLWASSRPEKADDFISIPKDVVPTCEINCGTASVVQLGVISQVCQKEVVIKELQPYPQVCIQCNMTFSSRMELSAHELTSNHSSVFSY